MKTFFLFTLLPSLTLNFEPVAINQNPGYPIIPPFFHEHNLYDNELKERIEEQINKALVADIDVEYFNSLILSAVEQTINQYHKRIAVLHLIIIHNYKKIPKDVLYRTESVIDDLAITRTMEYHLYDRLSADLLPMRDIIHHFFITEKRTLDYFKYISERLDRTKIFEYAEKDDFW